MNGRDRVATLELRADIKESKIAWGNWNFMEMSRQDGAWAKVKAMVKFRETRDFIAILNKSKQHVADVEASREELCCLHDTKMCYCVEFQYKGEITSIDLKGIHFDNNYIFWTA